MVVDDESDILTVIKRGLEQNDFAVDSFANPEEALTHFKPDYYALVITDIRMSNINGFELYRELKKKDDKVKIAFMTAFDIYENEFKKVFKNAGVKLFFKKPVRVSELVKKVKEELQIISL